MTRSEVETAIYRYLNKNNATPNTETQARIRGYVADTIRDVLTTEGFELLRRATLTFASVASQAEYGLPLAFAKIARIVDRSNRTPLIERDLTWLREVEPDPASTASRPLVYVQTGWQATQLQPSNASELFVKSSAAGDTTQKVYVDGYVTGGLARISSSSGVTLTGTTAVSLGATITTWEHITKFYSDTVGAGIISLHEDSGAGTTLAQIPIGATSSRYQTIALWPTPSAVVTYTVDGLRSITDLAQNADPIPWPEDFHQLAVYGACRRECLRLDDSRTRSFGDLEADQLRKLKMWVWGDATTDVVAGRRAHGVGYSNLGSMFPADLFR
jgi:hypothetical protein